MTLITIGVDDLERSLAFYRDGLGLVTAGIVGREFEYGAVAFFELQSGLRLALWPRASIAHDTGLPRNEAAPTDFTLAHNVSSKQQVDEVMTQARNAGATIVKPAQDTFYGGSGHPFGERKLGALSRGDPEQTSAALSQVLAGTAQRAAIGSTPQMPDLPAAVNPWE